MRSLILSAAGRVVVPVLLLYSVALLLLGHKEPGGGFSGGLVAAAALILRSLILDPSSSASRFAILRLLIAGGLGLCGIAGLLPLLGGQDLFKLVSFHLTVPPGVHLDTVLLFELGVYLISAGAALLILETVIEE